MCWERSTAHPRQRRLAVPRDPDCATCVRREFRFLHRPGGSALALCGRNTVQIPARGARPVLAHLARALAAGSAEVQLHERMLRFAFEGGRVSVFPDGRALVEGTSDVERAADLFERALGGSGPS